MKVIIQPSTYERNLGGICYMPYWVYSYYRTNKIDVVLFENVTLREFDTIINKYSKDDFLIDLSSYPQIDLALLFKKECVKLGINFSFIGYKPLIDKLKLPYISEKVDFLTGCFNSIYFLEETKYGLLSDCDNHLVQIKETKKVVPIFLSVGCKRGCEYCYCTNTNYPYGQMTREQIKNVIDYCNSKNYNIHFCDENFYYHKEIKFIIDCLKNKNIKYIALADSLSLSNIIESKYCITEDDVLESGNVLNEVGLEVIDLDVLLKKQNISPLLNTKLKIFWLTMTFLPNDSLKNHNMTGEFLSKYGYRYDELLDRIRTNSTQGGLGQFFQPYDGLKNAQSLKEKGVFLTERPIRLRPSFVGFKYLSEIPKKISPLDESDYKWFLLYGISKEEVNNFFELIDGEKTIKYLTNLDPDKLIISAILARLNRIQAK